MSNTDLLITENLQDALKHKDDAVTIRRLESNNLLLLDELEHAQYPRKEILQTQFDANKMLIKRLKTGKY